MGNSLNSIKNIEDWFKEHLPDNTSGKKPKNTNQTRAREVACACIKHDYDIKKNELDFLCRKGKFDKEIYFNLNRRCDGTIYMKIMLENIKNIQTIIGGHLNKANALGLLEYFIKNKAELEKIEDTKMKKLIYNKQTEK